MIASTDATISTYINVSEGNGKLQIELMKAIIELSPITKSQLAKAGNYAPSNLFPYPT
ncbi:hypothetical protein [Arenicella sp. 4NH20-0111]|uniref:hypothetical protein n=1 Tax=Arenicella sp. 4NH20-0111 TaxID=3127648 RepID=UPI00333E2322